MVSKLMLVASLVVSLSPVAPALADVIPDGFESWSPQQKQQYQEARRRFWQDLRRSQEESSPTPAVQPVNPQPGRQTADITAPATPRQGHLLRGIKPADTIRQPVQTPTQPSASSQRQLAPPKANPGSSPSAGNSQSGRQPDKKTSLDNRQSLRVDFPTMAAGVLLTFGAVSAGLLSTKRS